ncbi:MAG: hypothetical protein BGO07_00445 [Alphaproteobacteria bacterium 40-19]|nr:MAG: hypothetical protein BGO07_00445 [Alphaproteobacteria bacterium 40-19]
MKEGEEKQVPQAQLLTETDKQEIVRALQNDIIRVENQKYPKAFYEKLLGFTLEHTHTNEDIYNLIFTRKMFPIDLKIDYLLKNQNFYNFFKETLIKKEESSFAVMADFIVKFQEKMDNIEYTYPLYCLVFLSLANRNLIDQLDVMNCFLNKNVDLDEKKKEKMFRILQSNTKELNDLHPAALCS